MRGGRGGAEVSRGSGEMGVGRRARQKVTKRVRSHFFSPVVQIIGVSYVHVSSRSAAATLPHHTWYYWKPRYDSSRVVRPLLCDSATRSFCVCPMFVRFCRKQVCVRGVRAVTKSVPSSSGSTTPAVFHALAFVPVATVYVRVLGEQHEMIEPPSACSRPTQQSKIHRRTSHQVYEAYNSGKISSSYISLQHDSPFRHAMPTACQTNPISKGNLV